jgi:hypothetical protein
MFLFTNGFSSGTFLFTSIIISRALGLISNCKCIAGRAVDRPLLLK